MAGKKGQKKRFWSDDEKLSICGQARVDYDDARAVHAATHVLENARLFVIGDTTERQLRRAISRWPSEYLE
jgi:hypothetical protein